MGLNYPGEWKFEGIGFGVPSHAVNDFFGLIVDIAGGSQDIIETFKSTFGLAGASSSYTWSEGDLQEAMSDRSENAAVFVDSFWKGVEAVRETVSVPSPTVVNKLLAKHGVPLILDPPNLSLADTVIVDTADNHQDGAEGTASEKYILGEKIGAGGFGEVYKATKRTSVSDFVFALKILDPSPFVGDYEKALRRFRREIQALQSLQHRAIVPCIEAGLTADNKPYIVMPFIEGTDFRTAAAATDLSNIIHMFIEVLSALVYAHGENVIHRDLKPTNIIVRGSDRQPIILDFGSAFLLDQLDSEGLTTNLVSTVGYIPSEVVADPKRRTHLHDIYACGIILYEVLARCRPDPANYRPLSEWNSRYSALDEIVQQAISGEATRTPSAQTFLEQLAALSVAQ